MFNQAQVQQDFSAAATVYDQHASLQQHVLHRLVNKVRDHLKPNALILDAGCGTGLLSRIVPHYEVIQLDLAYGMCAVAAQEHAPAINGSVERLPFADQTFNAVISSLVLQWVGDSAQAYSEMKRVLKPGGVLALSSFGTQTLQELKASFAQLDAYNHVSAFEALPIAFEIGTIVETYPTLASLMKHLKTIGARNKMQDARKSLMTKRQLEAVEHYYRAQFGSERGLPVTWEVQYAVEMR